MAFFTNLFGKARVSSAEGGIFVFPGSQEAGKYSFHFDHLPTAAFDGRRGQGCQCYASFVNEPLALGDGSKFRGNKHFDEVSYDKVARKFIGTLNWLPSTCRGATRWEYCLQFDPEFTKFSGEVRLFHPDRLYPDGKEMSRHSLERVRLDPEQARFSSAEGGIFAFPGNNEGGKYSFHFDELPTVAFDGRRGRGGQCYVSFVNEPSTLGDGSEFRGHKRFDEVSYDKVARKFDGTLNWAPSTCYGATRWEYCLHFNPDFTKFSGEVILSNPDSFYPDGRREMGRHSLERTRIDVKATGEYNTIQALNPAPHWNGFTFFFLNADRLRSWKPEDGQLKCFQELRKEPGWLISEHIDFGHLLRGGYTFSHAVVSHRWKHDPHPDQDCEQMQRLREWLLEEDNKSIEFVWFDFGSLPQGERTKTEKAFFDASLNVVNYLYLGLRVLILFDLQYVGRFWCAYEAFLSMHNATEGGIRSAADDSRYTVLCLGASQAAEQDNVNALRTSWKFKTTEEASRVLAHDDIKVTNKKDKLIQLEKLKTMSDDVKKLFAQTQKA